MWEAVLKAPGGSRRFLAGPSGLGLLSSYNFYPGFGLDVTEKGWAEGRVRGANRYKGVNYNKEPFLLQFLCRKHMFSDAGSSWVKDTL